MALQYIRRQYYQGKIVAYFKKNGSVLRYKLFSIDEKYLNNRLRVKKDYVEEDYEELNKRIDELEENVDEAVKAILKENPYSKINNSILSDFFINQSKNEDSSDSNILLRDFQTYIEDMKRRKSAEDVEKGIIRPLHPSCKDYISTCNALSDFEYDRGQILYLDDIEDDFLEEFIEYLAEDRISTEEHTYKTKGGLANGSINKRLDCLATFIRHFYKDLEKAALISMQRQSNEQTDVIRLTKDELISLSTMELQTETEIRIRDFFVFICLTGLRFSDLVQINKLNFVSRPNGTFLTLYTHKTIKRAEIPLTNRALKIAQKYEYDFSYYTNQAFNRMLKELFTKYDLFGDETVKMRLVKKAVKSLIMLRRDRMSAHTGRRTFISILVEEGVALSRIMAMTGHTKETTLKIYVDKFSPNLKDSILPLNF